MEALIPKKKILILGSTGMLGHVLYSVLQKESNIELYDIAYRTKLTNKTIICDVLDIEVLEKEIVEISPDVIINCVGILLKNSKINPANTIFINSYLPNKLKDIADKINARVIQISTDCVFNGKKGLYSEKDLPNAKDLYGRSKMLGELINERDLTIRTSIIGPELKTEGQGLFNWYLNQNLKIYGYSNVFWGGVTTITLSKSILYCIGNPRITGLKHLTNGIKISKYDLLCLFLKFFPKKNLIIEKIEVENSDKSLWSENLNEIIKVPSYIEMIEEMKTFINT
jgi:dTDP-4-dehydrorhamnose reductase